MSAVLEVVLHWAADNWLKCLSMLTFLTVLPAYFRARYLWRRRMFFTRINFSLNFIEDGVLRFRTIRENDLAHVLLNNAHAIRLLVKTARAKRPGAFLLFKDREEAWTILNTLLNELSAQFSEGYLARCMGMPTRSTWYVMGLTCEKHDVLKTTKIRLMIIPKQLLMDLDKYEGTGLQFEAPHHHIRLDTLKEMRAIALDPVRQYNVMDIEISVKE
jgi:hypothetical protein